MSLSRSLTKQAKLILQSPCLQAMLNKKISREAFKFYVTEKNQIAENFQRLLNAGIEKAKKNGNEELAKVLEKNLMDERGQDENGIINLEESHKYWLKCYLNTINIDPANLPSHQLASTAAHKKLMLELEKEGNLFKIVGAILMIERIVPLEYRCVQISRDYCYPEEFTIYPNDTSELREEKKLARKYIDDHIKHDASEHFPDLLKQLEKYQADNKIMVEIEKGINLIAKARLAFFNEVAGFWLDIYHEPIA